MITLLGAPFDLCGRTPGSRLGPLAVELCGVMKTLEPLAKEGVQRREAFPLTHDLVGDHALDLPGASMQAWMHLKHAVSETLAEGNFPVMLGGDHSLAIGSIAGALEHYPRLAVLWVDAHADLNTPATSPSGNYHGMSLAALTRQGAMMPDPFWQEVLQNLVPEAGVLPDRLAWIGLRDVDEGERDLINSLDDPFVATMQHLDLDGVQGTMRRFFDWVKAHGIEHIWVSFDVDALDPGLAPGTGTAVRGGLTYREGHLIAEMLHAYGETENGVQLVGMDVVEVNPLADTANQTAQLAVEWIASFFGKSILGPAGSPSWAEARR